MKRRYRFFLTLMGILGYLLFLPRSLAPALTLSPKAAYALNEVRNGEDSADPVPFATSRYVGFLHTDGSPMVSEQVRYGAAASGMGFINYDAVSQRLVLKNSDGGFDLLIDTRGYPFFIGDRLLVVSTDRLRLQEFSQDGDLLWRFSAPSLITTCAGDDKRIVLGLLNGSFMFLDRNGKVLHTFRPEGSRISVAYGAGVDPDSDAYLLLAGVDPQMAYLMEERNGEFRRIEEIPLASDLRRNIQVFLPLDSVFAVEQEDGFLLLERTTLQQRSFTLPGRLLYLDGSADYRLLLALSEGTHGDFLSLLGADSSYRGELFFDADAAGGSIMVNGNRVFVLLNDRVLVYRLERV